MNPLKSIWGTIISGFILSIIIIYALGSFKGGINPWEISVWLHVLAGVVWIGLLYYFNFVQVPAVAQALADNDPGPAAINKYVAPRALAWFRWGALVTWITGVGALQHMGGAHSAFMLADGMAIIGVGAWLGTIMLLNVWGIIWPCQKRILGMKEASPEQIAKCKVWALMASRTNTLLSIPMLMAMTAQGHGLPF